jgi:hypothetical protein
MTATVTDSTRNGIGATSLSRGSLGGRGADRWFPSTNAGSTADTQGAGRTGRLEQGKHATADGVQTGTRAVLVAFAVFTLLATNQLLMLTASTDRYFAWTIHAEPTAAFLGAAYAAGFVLSVLALRQDRWSHIRVAIVTVTAFTVFTLIPTFIHLHKFHLGASGLARFAAWLWLAVYIVIPVACFVVVGRQQRRRGPAETVRRPMPGWLRGLLAAQGVTLFAAGAVLFARGARVHHMAADVTGFWPWPLTPLTAQTVGAWLLAFGLAAALAIWERDLIRLFVPAVAYTAFGAFELLVVLRYRTQVGADDPRLWAYVAVLATIVATGGYGWWAAQRRPRAAREGIDAAERSPSRAGQPSPVDAVVATSPAHALTGS